MDDLKGEGRIGAAQVLAMLVGTLAVGYFVLWACAPTANLTPSTHIAKGKKNIELGASVLTQTLAGKNANNVPPGRTLSTIEPPIYPDGYLNVRHREEKYTIGAVAFAGDSSLFGVGSLFEAHLIDNGEMTLSLGAEAGFLWAAISLPITYKLTDDAMIFTRPFLRLGLVGLQLPVGLLVNLNDGLSLALSASTDFLLTDFDLDPKLEPFGFRFGLHLGQTF